MLDFDGLNYWAIIVAWLINVILGSFWYSPAGFGKKWSKYTGIDMMKMPQDQANRAIGFVILSGLVQAFVLAVVLNSIGVTKAVDGLVAGLFICLGLTAATTIGNTLYSRLSWGFWWLNASYFLLVMGLNSMILAVWR